MQTGNKNRRAPPFRDTALLMAVIALFVIIVTFGWFHLVYPLTGDAVVSICLALLLTLIAILLARFIGEQPQLDNDDDTRTGRYVHFCLFYPFLFIISALGTMNTVVVRFEAPSVLQNDIDYSQIKLQQLESSSGRLLGNDEFEAKQQKLNTLLAALKPEIVDTSRGGDYCGVGSHALAIIAEIEKLLPGFRLPTGIFGRNRCDQINGTMIYDGLERQARQILYASINPVFAKISGDLNTAQAKLSAVELGLGGTADGGSATQGYLKAQDALRYAATAYENSRAAAVSASPTEAQSLLPPETKIDVSHSLTLGSIFSLVPTLWARVRYGSTWAVIATAIAFDVGLVLLFGQVAKTRSGRQTRPSYTTTDPLFLWVNS